MEMLKQSDPVQVTDYVLMEGRGFGFVTFSDPASAQTFLEVRALVSLEQ